MRNRNRLPKPPKDIKKPTPVKNVPLNEGGPKPPVKKALPKNKSLPKKGNSNDNARMAGSNSDRRDRSGGGPKRSPLKRIDRRAHKLTNSMIRDEVDDLRSQRSQVNTAADNANDLTETFYTRAKGDLSHLLGETQEFIGGQASRNASMFDTTQVEQSAANAALQQQLGQIYGQARQGTNAELDALGINNGQFGGQMVADQAFQQGQAAQSGANSLTNLNFMQQNAGQMSGLLAGMAQGSYMSHSGRALNDRNDQLADTANERAEQLGLVQEAIQEAKGSRKDVFLELMTQLQNSPWGASLMEKGKKGGPNGNPGNGNNNSGSSDGGPNKDSIESKMKAAAAKKKPAPRRRPMALSELQLNNYDNKKAVAKKSK